MASTIGDSDDLLGEIESLLEDGEIESGTPAYTVAWKVARQGFLSLTAREAAIYARAVRPALERRRVQLREPADAALPAEPIGLDPAAANVTVKRRRAALR